jgi:hypothetical protein
LNFTQVFSKNFDAELGSKARDKSRSGAILTGSKTLPAFGLLTNPSMAVLTD